ncbi:MAG: type II secretion system minor pseudopilin GspK [Deltaproteobacteria bacterium]|nr:type II secretion system minor pseudopilin GspK [Deltaproteobacteria bacterium]
MVRKKRAERGFALIITLLITAVIVGLVVEVIYRVYLSSTRVENFTNSQRASILARAGIDLTQAGLEALMKVEPHKTMDEGGWSFSNREEDSVVTISVFDELGRVSTRVVYPNTGAQNDKVHATYSRLLDILEQDDSLTETLADWIDGDDEPRPGGGEGIDYYQHLPHPYVPKNNYLATGEELLMVKGYTPAIFETIAPFITTYSDTGLININTAGREVIMALSEEITEDLAQEVIDFRNDTPFKDKSDIMQVPGFETIGFTLQDRVAVDSTIFRVFSVAQTADAVREVEAVIQVGGGVLYWRER